MNHLTTDHVQSLLTTTTEDFTFLAPTVAYLQVLLTPYAQALEPVTEFQLLKNWIPAAFKGELADHLMEELDEIEGDLAAEQIVDAGPDQFVNRGRAALLDHLLLELSSSATDYLQRKDPTSNVVTPWTLQAAISLNSELTRLFLGGESTTLPVTVTIGPQDFVHQLSQDFVAGLMVSYDLYVAPAPEMKLFDQTIQWDDLQAKYQIDEDADFHRPYVMATGAWDYEFDDPTFLQGYKTGLLWQNITEETKISELRHEDQVVAMV